MDFTYIIYGENIYYLDENNVIFSIEGFHGVVREGFNKSSFIKPILALNNNSFIEGATPEEIAQQQIINLKQKETDLYIKRMQDAQRIWAGLSAEFRIAKQVGQMDDATENIILAELKPVLDIVVPFGQWVTGYQLLLGVGSSVIGQPLYDKIHNILWNYIQENYEEMEVSELKQSINKK